MNLKMEKPALGTGSLISLRMSGVAYLIARAVSTFFSETPIERKKSAILESRAAFAVSFLSRSCLIPSFT